MANLKVPLNANPPQEIRPYKGIGGIAGGGPLRFPVEEEPRVLEDWPKSEV